jgi:hypothetical protein
MTIPLEEIKARLLETPEVKAEYDALAPEFEIAAQLVKARLRGAVAGRARSPHGHQPVRDRQAGKRANAAEHEDFIALRRGYRQQVSSAAVGGLIGGFPHQMIGQ